MELDSDPLRGFGFPCRPTVFLRGCLQRHQRTGVERSRGKLKQASNRLDHPLENTNWIGRFSSRGGNSLVFDSFEPIHITLRFVSVRSGMAGSPLIDAVCNKAKTRNSVWVQFCGYFEDFIFKFWRKDGGRCWRKDGGHRPLIWQWW